MLPSLEEQLRNPCTSAHQLHSDFQPILLHLQSPLQAQEYFKVLHIILSRNTSLQISKRLGTSLLYILPHLQINNKYLVQSIQLVFKLSCCLKFFFHLICSRKDPNKTHTVHLVPSLSVTEACSAQVLSHSSTGDAVREDSLGWSMATQGASPLPLLRGALPGAHGSLATERGTPLPFSPALLTRAQPAAR